MRILFSIYAINISVVLFFMILASHCLKSSNPELFQKMLLYTLFYTYFIFGPLLLILCILSLSAFAESLLFICDSTNGYHGQKVFDYKNIVQIILALMASLGIIFFFTLLYTVQRTQTSLRDENSIMSRIYFGILRCFP